MKVADFFFLVFPSEVPRLPVLALSIILEPWLFFCHGILPFTPVMLPARPGSCLYFFSPDLFHVPSAGFACGLDRRPFPASCLPSILATRLLVFISFLTYLMMTVFPPLFASINVPLLHRQEEGTPGGSPSSIRRPRFYRDIEKEGSFPRKRKFFLSPSAERVLLLLSPWPPPSIAAQTSCLPLKCLLFFPLFQVN